MKLLTEQEKLLWYRKITEAKNLEQLTLAIAHFQWDVDYPNHVSMENLSEGLLSIGITWDDLPTFGGDRPDNVVCPLSWDKKEVLVHCGDFCIVKRKDFPRFDIVIRGDMNKGPELH